MAIMQPPLICTGITSVAENKNRVVAFGLRRYEIVLNIEAKLVEIALGAQIETDTAGRIHLLQGSFLQLLAVKRFQREFRH